MRRRGLVVALSACLACVSLASLTLIVPSAPTTDPWGWILWGREITNFEFSTELRGSPSWKPLPVFLTAPLALVGESAPTLWILAARALGLLALVLAFLLAGRLVGDRSIWLRSAAGAIAVIGIILGRAWIREFSHAYSEPAALALLLAAIHCHLSGRRSLALVLGAAVTLSRPEAFALVAAYGALLLWRREAKLWVVAGVLVAVPAAWLVPDWVGSGDPFHGAELSDRVLDHDLKSGARSVVDIIPVPLFFAAIAGSVLALVRRDRAFLEVAGLGLAWYGLYLLLRASGYPARPRFLDIPAGVLCVAGAAALVQLVMLARPLWIRAVLAPAAIAVLAMSFVPRVNNVVDAGETSVIRAQIQWDLSRAITRAGGADLSRCGPVVMPGGYRWMKGMVSWRLGVPLRDVYNLRTRYSWRIGKALAHGKGRRIGPTIGGRPGRRPVKLVVPRKPVVVLLPFAGTRMELAGERGAQLERLGSYGQWVVATSDPGGCRAQLSRSAG